MHKIKTVLKKSRVILKIYVSLNSTKNYICAFICRVALLFSPKLHSRFMYWFQGKGCPRVNIKNPTLFNEKIEWLKYYSYNDSDLAALTYDKNDVRDYVESVGLKDILVPKIGVWSKIDDIPWDELPQRFILKSTNGWSNHVFCYDKDKLDIKEAKRILKTATRRRYLFWTNGVKYALKNPTKYLCEELIDVDENKKVPDDYKFYCFNGEPKFVLYCFDRAKEPKFVFLDCDWTVRKDLRADSYDFYPQRPDNLKEMIEYSRKLSKPFAFARIDLYNENNKVFFGEITLTPSSAYKMYRDVGDYGLTELGNMIDLSQVDVEKNKSN